jgi:hypothetical protein
METGVVLSNEEREKRKSEEGRREEEEIEEGEKKSTREVKCGSVHLCRPFGEGSHGLCLFVFVRLKLPKTQWTCAFGFKWLHALPSRDAALPLRYELSF